MPMLQPPVEAAAKASRGQCQLPWVAERCRLLHSSLPPLRPLLPLLPTFWTSLQYYFSPAGKRYRSRMEIARDFGLADEKEPRPSTGGKPRSRKSEGSAGGGGGGSAAAAAAVPAAPLTREAALAAAVKRRQAFVLPHRLACGVTVTDLGVLHPNNPGGAAGEEGTACCPRAGLRTYGLPACRLPTWL